MSKWLKWIKVKKCQEIIEDLFQFKEIIKIREKEGKQLCHCKKRSMISLEIVETQPIEVHLDSYKIKMKKKKMKICCLSEILNIFKYIVLMNQV